MRVYAPCPSHHARTSCDAHRDFARHSANVGLLGEPLRHVFFSGYCRSVWNDRELRFSTRLHCAHVCVCVDTSANRRSTHPVSVFSAVPDDDLVFAFAGRLAAPPFASSLCSCSKMNRWNAWTRLGLLWSSLVSSSSRPSIKPSAAASRTCRSVRKKFKGCAVTEDDECDPAPRVGGCASMCDRNPSSHVRQNSRSQACPISTSARSSGVKCSI